ncbi:DEAD/DEAH box helicase [Dyadobacter fermentans]|uniref:Non-specific serine/threonine protein kinase n=1 Tax=Dyadobacter fermentans (strain ATCC 700827 / DSM 18053 / CIP 107007 / KCTC 52180 / NS114) TaxID=471854 RepID=C6W3T3_DYAFD|nr:DEAD/DEAH box helicase [Dyadobacter fermentans]ACT95781.1 Non-specific serine/threonine protein kinase [Dyadobacter fermentans DSM 18053]
MKVSPAEPFKIVYSILNHEYLGYIFEAFVVQLTSQGDFSFQIQNISSKNIKEFRSGLDTRDFELVKLIDDIQQDAVLKKYNPKKLNAVDFFLKVYDPQKGDKAVQETIAGYLENCKSRILERLDGKEIFIMGNDGNPLWKPVSWEPEKATIRFHFIRNEDNTHYFPTIRHKMQKLDFQYKNAFLICEDPAWLVLDGHLYHFEGNVDGKKIKPFLAKKFIAIPGQVEEQYYGRFVAPLIASYDVVARGFEIRNVSSVPKTILTISEYSTANPKKSTVLFQDSEDVEVLEEEDNDVTFELSFQYAGFSFHYDSFAHASSVHMEKRGNEYFFNKVKRNIETEGQHVRTLKDMGLNIRNGKVQMPKSEAFGWLQGNAIALDASGISVRQNTADAKRYFLGYSSLDISIQEGRDWFDINAKVRFGEFEIPFIQLRNYILNRKKEFLLPSGEIAVIPEWWFTKYSEFFSFTESSHDDDDQLRLRMHHLALVQELKEDNLATAVISRKLENLRNFQQIEPAEAPHHFQGILRPYQKTGYDWLRFLKQYRFGGCLADDMGLGKTVQTLALLQSEKEGGADRPSILIMPTSLLYNWQLEASKFTPDLRVLLYTGTNREKDTAQFDHYDLILTSYGIIRLDIDLMEDYRFNYVILDESQAIKNPSSIITKAVRRLNSAHRLVLTGTPIENNTLDLWSQMSFVNPGLLGSQTFFRDEFQVPIEKKGDEEKTKRLYNLIKPFILRRLKSQVATDLPEKVESIQYCDMSGEQEKAYEEAKAYYRNLILQSIDSEGMSKSQLVVLQGLTRLRQLANHPVMVDPEYAHDSGKFEDVLYKLQTVMSEDHKILIFSQYIKHLDLFRHYLDEKEINYAYLDGATRDRQEQVESFQNDENIKIFLISLKAGGLGLNLTAADYVFILDPWWNPAIEAQAVDRAHRIGQDRTVFTYKFITKNSVEEKILALQRSKKQLADDLISSEEGFIKSLTREDVLNLLS